MSSDNPMEKRLRIAGVLVLTGLLVELVALHWVHPAAFLMLAFVGIPIMSLGIAIYLYSLISLPTSPNGTTRDPG
jgi:hypothetical protein